MLQNKIKKIRIIGCGISGATLANLLAKKGWVVDIYEKNDFVGGNCFDSKNEDGILIHNFGPHIFHTSNEEVYHFISQYTTLNSYVNKVLVYLDSKTFPLPINFESINTIMGNKSKKIIDTLKRLFSNKKTITLFDLQKVQNPLLDDFANYIFKNVYANYSTKMWGLKFNQIDKSTINRVKIVLGYDHNYFPEDKYQGLPINGYTEMIKKMINHKNIHLHLNIDVKDHLKITDKMEWDKKQINGPIVYCGSLDELFNYRYGVLPYRSLNIKFQTYKLESFQQVAVINYPADQKMTRICEYKKMTFQKSYKTTISKEYPGKFELDSKVFNKRYYPIINSKNLSLYNKYLSLLLPFKKVYCLGRLAQYKYFDMDDAIAEAFLLAKEINNA